MSYFSTLTHDSNTFFQSGMTKTNKTNSPVHYTRAQIVLKRSSNDTRGSESGQLLRLGVRRLDKFSWRNLLAKIRKKKFYSKQQKKIKIYRTMEVLN